MTKFKSFLLIVILSLFIGIFPLKIIAASGGADYNAKNAQCNQYNDETACNLKGCLWDDERYERTKETGCYAPTCAKASLDDDCTKVVIKNKKYELSYCTPTVGGTARGCTVKKTCADLAREHSVLAYDDFGESCDSGEMGGISLLVYNDQYVQPSVSPDDFCRTAYEWRNKPLSKNDKYAYCAPYKSNQSAYNTCMGGITYKTIYDEQCTGGGTTCTDGHISTVVHTSSTSKSYKCICPYNTTEVNGKCVSTGGSGTTCKTVNSYVEEFDKLGSGNVCLEQNACSYADCSDNGDAEPYDKSKGKKFYTGVDSIVVNGVDTGPYGSDARAWAYTGTCNNKSTDVFCIDPVAKYHDNTANYSCKASMNENSTIDQGYIKIYQEALNKYEDLYKTHQSLCKSESDCEPYQGMHFAFRFWTFYSGIGRTTDFYEEEGLSYVQNSAIAEGFNGTAQKIMNNPNSTYFRITQTGSRGGGLIDGWTIPNPANKKGYWDAVDLFMKAANDHENIWVSTLKFVQISNDKNTKTAKVSLTGIQGLKDSRFADMNFVKHLYCVGCQITTNLDPNYDYLKNGVESVEFEVKYSGTSYTVGVYYYDRRDGKNVILATAEKANDYQRLLFTTASELTANNVREFRYEETFSPDGKPKCTISGNTLYLMNGSATSDFSEWMQECCVTYKTLKNKANRDTFCTYLTNVYGTNNANYRAVCTKPYDDKFDTWVDNGCKLPCTTNNTTPNGGSCDNLQGDKVVISDLTSGEYLPNADFIGSGEYCLSCLDNKNTTTTKTFELLPNNPYCTVYCVEEYKFKVPQHLGTLDENSSTIQYGRYFRLDVPATVKRTCYTKTTPQFTNGQTNGVYGINYNQFKRDLLQQEKNVDAAISTYNQLVNAKAAASRPGAISSSSYSCFRDRTVECPDGLSKGKVPPRTGENKGYGYVDCDCLAADGGSCVHPTKVEDGCSGSTKSYSYSATIDGVVRTYTSDCGCSNSCGEANSCSADSVLSSIQSDIDAAKKAAEDAIRTYNSIISTYNSCYMKDSNLNLCIDGVKDSNPYITYSYPESYYMNLIGSNNRLVGNWHDAGSQTRYYESVSASNAYCDYTGAQSAELRSTDKFAEYSLNDLSKTNGKIDVQVNRYVIKSVTKEATLSPATDWYTKIGDGSATTSSSGNVIHLGHVLPISRHCEEGVYTYNYELRFKNVGQDITSCQTGRLDKYQTNTTNKYVCDYKIKYKGIGCEGCETTYYFRPISLTDVFPKSGLLIQDLASKNGRYYTDTSVKNSKLANERSVAPNWATEKGKYTQKRIEEIGESVYTPEYLEYSYTLTPAGMKQIKAYNEATHYGDFNLKCNGNNCTSNFLDEVKNYSGVTENKRDPSHKTYTDGSVWK